DQLAKAQAELKSAHEQMDRTKSKSSENLNRLSELQSQLNQLAQEKVIVNKELDSIKSQTQETEKRYQELLKKRDDQVAGLSTDNKVLQEKVKVAQGALEDISVENKERQARLAELDKKILDSHKDIEKISQTNKQLERDLALSNEKWQHLNATVSKTVDEAKKELEQKVRTLTLELASVQDQLKAKNTQLELVVKQKEYMVKSADQFLQKVSTLDKQSPE
ncbi:MAG: hypothetical protein JNJ47_06225, partial [Alphaproteobacteria bacterium]|nr:hypothetical protein [Alphaproteobacteria bacterium]